MPYRWGDDDTRGKVVEISHKIINLKNSSNVLLFLPLSLVFEVMRKLSI